MTAGRKTGTRNTHWCTPPRYVDAVKAFFDGRVSLDPCSNNWSIVGAETEFMLPRHDGLGERWDHPTIFVNPPYGADRERQTSIRDWLRKCAEAAAVFGSEVLALIPVATNTRHWKECVWHTAAGVCFLYDTRLRFLVEGRDEGKGAPMSCAMVFWGEDFARFSRVFAPFGAVVDIRTTIDDETPRPARRRCASST